MKENFDFSVNFVLLKEGGYVNDPNDSGGETNFGIAKKYHPNIDIKNLTKEQAVEVYRQEYWIPAGCEALPWPMDMIHFDSTVNCGIKKANQFLSQAQSWNHYLILRIKYYLDLNRSQYTRGWVSRVIDLYLTIMQLRGSCDWKYKKLRMWKNSI